MMFHCLPVLMPKIKEKEKKRYLDNQHSYSTYMSRKPLQNFTAIFKFTHCSVQNCKSEVFLSKVIKWRHFQHPLLSESRWTNKNNTLTPLRTRAFGTRPGSTRGARVLHISPPMQSPAGAALTSQWTASRTVPEATWGVGGKHPWGTGGSRLGMTAQHPHQAPCGQEPPLLAAGRPEGAGWQSKTRPAPRMNKGLQHRFHTVSGAAGSKGTPRTS